MISMGVLVENPFDTETLSILNRRNRNLRRVNEVSQKLTSLLCEDEVMYYLLEGSAEIIGAPVASLWMWENDTRQALCCTATYPPHEREMLQPYRLNPNEGVAGWVVTHQMSVVTRNAYEDQRFTAEIDKKTGFNTQSMLAVPVRIRDEVIGVIEILNKLNADFDDEDVTMVETLAAAAAIALDNARLVTSLQAQNAELDAFAHTVAHDLKGPMSAILGYSDFLLEAGNDVDINEVAQICRIIAKSASKMNNIIHEILLLSGVRKAKVAMNPIRMEEVIMEATSRLSHMIEDFNCQLITPKSWPTVLGYAAWIEEIWINYISNAIKYGGPTPQIELGYTEEETGVWFWVKDQGNGLTEEQQQLLFAPFSRLEQVRVEGHGLGLSIVHRIVQKLDGQVAIDSKIGVGSTFKFFLDKPY